MATVRLLRMAGHEGIHLREVGLCRLPDCDIVEKGRADEAVVLTCDLDFGDLLAAGAMELPSVVIFRLSDYRPSAVNPRLLAVIREQTAALERGAIVIVEDFRYRVRPLPIASRSK